MNVFLQPDPVSGRIRPECVSVEQTWTATNKAQVDISLLALDQQPTDLSVWAAVSAVDVSTTNVSQVVSGDGWLCQSSLLSQTQLEVVDTFKLTLTDCDLEPGQKYNAHVVLGTLANGTDALAGDFGPTTFAAQNLTAYVWVASQSPNSQFLTAGMQTAGGR